MRLRGVKKDPGDRPGVGHSCQHIEGCEDKQDQDWHPGLRRRRPQLAPDKPRQRVGKREAEVKGGPCAENRGRSGEAASVDLLFEEIKL